MKNSLPVGWLAIYLRFIGFCALLAFVAALMPASWFGAATEGLGLDPFPDTPLAYYLARQLSLMYGFVGVIATYVSFHVERYHQLVGHFACWAIAFGVLQAVVDMLSGLPMWWTITEPGTTITGAVFLVGLQRFSEGKASPGATAPPDA